MKEIKALSKQIKDQEAEIKRISNEVEKTDRAAEAASQAVEAVSELRLRRAREMAAATVEKRAPDTAQIDVQIAETEAVSERRRIEADEAKAMGEILRARHAELQGELETLRLKRRGVAIAEMERMRGDAIDEYVDAVDKLGPIVARLKAADALIRRVNPSDALPKVMPGELLFNRIHAERMPIPWSHSDRPEPRRLGNFYSPHPSVAQALAAVDKFVPVLAAPEWMASGALVDAAVASEAEKLRGAGMEI
jgi:hypothetical protein